MSFISWNHTEYTPVEALERCRKGSVILDIRPEVLCLYKAFDVPNVLYCPWQSVASFTEELPDDIEIIVADSSGIQGREILDLLTHRGFRNIAGLAGGMVEWERDGMPVILDNKSRLSGSCMCQLKFRERNRT